MRPTLLMLFFLAFLLSLPYAQQNFSFIQVSDLHVPYSNSLSFIRSLKDIGPTYLEPYQVTAPTPSFVVATGDVTEFGGGWWKDYIDACTSTSLRWYHTPGNHDNTWWNIRPDLREVQGKSYLSWDYGGCHFILLDSATPQEPTPTFGREQIQWLQEDLKKVELLTPIFVFFHHPLGGSEYASSYEQERVLNLLRPYAMVVFVGGHYHRPKLEEYQGFPMIVGGQGYSDWAGYNVFCIQDGWLKVAYRKTSEPNATISILSKKLPQRLSSKIQVTLLNSKLSIGMPLYLEYHSEDIVPENAKIILDNKIRVLGNISESERTISFSIPSTLLPGQHFVVMTLSTPQRKYYQSFTFEIATEHKHWEAQIPGACKAGPVLGQDTVYAASLDGNLYALEKSTGKIQWTFAAQAEIIGKAAYEDSRIYFSSADGKVYTVTSQGSLLWSKDIGCPSYAPVLLADQRVFVADRQGRILALAKQDGSLIWEKQYASYTIESQMYAADGSLYFGAWDCYIHQCKMSDGTLIQQIKGIGSATKPGAVYYSPADCGPIAISGKLYATDRAYILGEWDIATGQSQRSFEKVAAIALSEDQKFLYLRRSSQELEKMGVQGTTVWITPELGDAVPIPPTEFQGKVYICSNKGKLSVLDASQGKILWQYQVTPGIRVYGAQAVDQTGVYIADMDGKITALDR